jgi:putative colanic acid biosynthesis glycosyltransferase
MKFFSIVTICRNDLPGLKRTLASLDLQTLEDYEWIVVDGNSNDGTKEWLASMTHFKWISEPDKGIYDAMNKGIRMAEGTYLIFMNSNDLFASSSVLENSRKLLLENRLPVFAFGDSIDVDETGKEYYRKAKEYQKNRIGMITQHQAMFFNRVKISPFEYDPKYPLSGDYALISNIIKVTRASDILKLSIPICKFTMGGLNESKRFEAIKEDYRIRKEIMRLPAYWNLTLYLLHYLHGKLKQIKPETRFIRHENLN